MLQIDILKSIKETSYLSYFLVFFGGMILSFGSCTLVRLPVVAGYCGGLSSSRRNSLKLMFGFIGGLVAGNMVYGALLGFMAQLARQMLKISGYIYLCLGVGLIAASIATFGLFGKNDECCAHEPQGASLKRFGIIGAFLFGLIFVLFEAPACPCCGPILFSMASATFAQGRLTYGLSLFFVYSLGQSVPLVAAGYSVGLIKFIHHRIENWQDFIRTVGAVVLFCLGLYFLWLA